MSAFKAANPRASFEDFIRWHSPADWEDDGNDRDWPPRGKLSQRMSGNHNNTWRNIWNEAPALSAKEQKPLMDPNSEGEKALHYLETVRPQQLLEQMVCTAFRAAADTLQQTNHGGMHVITSKLDQLYRTLSSVLKPSPHESACTGKGNLEDLKRACVALGHVERLLVVAASLHRKFPQSPRLSKAVFESFYDFYRPRMEIESTEHVSSEFKAEVEVSESEWSVVEKLFTPLNSAQSWRRVMSLGNLLNGHEPVIREIMFFGRDARATTPAAPSVDTYRMYIRGTSDSLEVAMSTVSRD